MIDFSKYKVDEKQWQDLLKKHNVTAHRIYPLHTEIAAQKYADYMNEVLKMSASVTINTNGGSSFLKRCGKSYCPNKKTIKKSIAYSKKTGRLNYFDYSFMIVTLDELDSRLSE